MNFIKTSILTGFSTIIKMLSNLVINKILAIYIGPAGIALIGQFQNVLGMITTIGNGAINLGVTKYVAEFHDNKEKRDNVISAALIITIIFSIFIGVGVFLFSEFLSMVTLHTEKYHSIFKVLGITLIFISLNTFLLALINGLKKIKLFIIVNISSSFLSLFVTAFLTIRYHLFGALISTIIIQIFILVFSLSAVYKLTDVKYKFNKNVPIDVYNKLFTYSLMAIVTIVTLPITQIAIRNHLINQFSIEQAGYWEAVWKISSMYLMVLTTAFSTYYLPKLSELKSKEELRKEILSGYKVIIPFVLICTIIIYVFRDFIILLLFTPEFKPMSSLFLFQLIGDFLKMSSWTLAFLMTAKAMLKTFIITEILFSISFYLLTILFTHYLGLTGVTLAFAISYLIYLLIMIIIFSDLLFTKSINNKF